MSAPQICPSDKARLAIAIVIAKHIPPGYSTIGTSFCEVVSGYTDPLAEYVQKLKRAFPVRMGGVLTTNDDRWLDRIKVLEQQLALAQANEARVQLELATYRAQHPSSSAPAPPDSDFPSAVESTSKRPTPDSPPRKHPKKKRKQGDSNPSTGSSKLGAEELDFAIQRLQSGECSFDPGTQARNIGLVSSLLRLRIQTLSSQTQTVSGSYRSAQVTSNPSQNDTGVAPHELAVEPLLGRCLADIASHIRHVCAHPTIPASLDGLNALRVVLPQVLVAAKEFCAAGPDLTHALVTLVTPIIDAFYPASVAILSPAARATASTRTKRGKVKTGARATREAEEASTPSPVDTRPGLLGILAMVARAMQAIDKGVLYAVLPAACQTIRSLLFTARPADLRGARLQMLAVRDSVWYLCGACHAVLEGVRLTDEDVELSTGCVEMLVEALQLDRGEPIASICARASHPRPGPGMIETSKSQGTSSSATHTNDAIRDMLGAVLERILLGV
ncbi:hypothetical protein CTheo_5079 [Ceratobasidium theobromae]|uniref:Uncharacterized protein n=1 Tax=Ceratobasidium theobromae TaxID=1582974 RepID=A0A5N5QIA6_9AGAM|nr:hypothetical protein CTheo_5079 [Ceratobasidium theobromae]